MNKQFIEDKWPTNILKIFNIPGNQKFAKQNDEIPVCVFLSKWQRLLINTHYRCLRTKLTSSYNVLV